uniref:Uncharacterized protein n=1 Tax=Glossina austeni TaxID=7395 RepID=A0A1A9UR38_GLOAU
MQSESENEVSHTLVWCTHFMTTHMHVSDYDKRDEKTTIPCICKIQKYVRVTTCNEFFSKELEKLFNSFEYRMRINDLTTFKMNQLRAQVVCKFLTADPQITSKKETFIRIEPTEIGLREYQYRKKRYNNGHNDSPVYKDACAHSTS